MGGSVRVELSVPIELELIMLSRSFASVEMNLILAKLHFKYDLKLTDPGLDWEGQSTLHVMWSKPSLYVQIAPVEHDDYLWLPYREGATKNGR